MPDQYCYLKLWQLLTPLMQRNYPTFQFVIHHILLLEAGGLKLQSSMCLYVYVPSEPTFLHKLGDSAEMSQSKCG